jgi:hypothetical protein
MPYVSPGRRALSPGGKGRFPGFDVLAEVPRWDDVTTGVVLARLGPDPELSFFTPPEQATASALLDQLLAQFDEPKVPVLQLVDHRLALDETDGWVYEDMADDREAWRISLAALDADARQIYGAPFHSLPPDQQCELIQGVQDASEWRGLPGGHVWSLWTRYSCAAFYSHPWAWNEIGFGGPAYPRGYKARGVGKRERWEVADQAGADPVPWAQRVELVRRRHEKSTGTKAKES